MNTLRGLCFCAMLAISAMAVAKSEGVTARSEVLMDSRFSGFDGTRHIEQTHPAWQSSAEAVSHWSAYYNVNPIAVFHLLKATASPGVPVKTIRNTARVLSEQQEPARLARVLSLPADSVNRVLEDSRRETVAAGLAVRPGAASDSPPALDLPFTRTEAWKFNGVHTWTGNDDGSPMSSIDFSADWSERWGADTSGYSVAAAHDGVITVHSSCFVTVQHGSGWATRYYHLDQLAVTNGQVVVAGQKIGIYADNEEQALCQGGHSLGPHVHFALMKDGSYRSLQGIALSGYVVHPGENSYDSSRQRMWLDKRGTQYFAYDQAIQTEPGDNTIDYRYNGMWLPVGHNGHGFSIDISESPVEQGTRKTIFVAFYTYDDFGLANFYAGNIDFDRWRSDETVTIGMLQTSGGDFTDLLPIHTGDPDAAEDAGSISLRFLDCNNAIADVSLDERSSGQPVEHSLQLVRLIGVPDHVCRAASLPLDAASGSSLNR